jgi:predicted dehydrogenase
MDDRIVDITPEVPKARPFDLQAASFIDVCLGRRDPFATGEQGVAVMKVLDAVYKSGESGREVRISRK